MKPVLLKVLAASFLVCIFACNNETKEEKAVTPSTAAPAAKEEPKKTEVSLGPDGAEVKTKTGEEVKVSESGGSVGTKDVKLKINTKDTTKK